MNEKPANRFEEAGRTIGALVSEKNVAYGDSFGLAGKVLAILYPDGVQPEQYRDMLTVVRVVDKLFRIATKKDAFGESPWRDVAGYGILGFLADEKPVDSERAVGGNLHVGVKHGESGLDGDNKFQRA